MINNVNKLFKIGFFINIFIILLSFYFRKDYINTDGLLYLAQASLFHLDSFETGISVHSWALYSYLISFLAKIFSTNLYYSAKILTIIFSVFIYIYLFKIILLFNKNIKKIYLIQIYLLVFFSNYLIFSYYYNFIIRDHGFWAFTIIGIYYYFLFIQNQSLKYFFMFFFSLLISILFRIDSLFLFIYMLINFVLIYFNKKTIFFKSSIFLCLLILFYSISDIGRLNNLYEFSLKFFYNIFDIKALTNNKFFDNYVVDNILIVYFIYIFIFLKTAIVNLNIKFFIMFFIDRIIFLKNKFIFIFIFISYFVVFIHFLATGVLTSRYLMLSNLLMTIICIPIIFNLIHKLKKIRYFLYILILFFVLTYLYQFKQILTYKNYESEIMNFLSAEYPDCYVSDKKLLFYYDKKLIHENPSYFFKDISKQDFSLAYDCLILTKNHLKIFNLNYLTLINQYPEYNPKIFLYFNNN